MTENKWLNFAGFLNSCIHDREHADCPYKEYRSMDQYQRLEFQSAITNDKAGMMMKKCHQLKCECSPLIFQKQESGWDLALAL